MQKYLSPILGAFILFLNSYQTKAERIDSVDVLHYKIEASLRNISSKQISGTSTLICLAKFANTKSLNIDLLKLPVSEILCNGQVANFQQTDSSVQIHLTQTFQKNDTLQLKISYAGSPSIDARWGGFYFSNNYAYNMGVGMASNPPNFGRCWFPCIDNFSDKATYEFHITTDSGYMAVCNGIQSPATSAANNGLTWHWSLSQEIPTYIANVAVSNYVLVNQVFHGLKRDIPIVLAVQAKDTNTIKASFAKLNNALQCFEERFGPYEFDRVGYVGVPFTSGAMEHAGNISYPLYAIDGTATYETLFAHELSHHWWGNLVTCKTASDMWLNEGWASYCEALFLECVYGKSAYTDKINSELFEALRWAKPRDGSYLPVSGVPLAQTYGTHVYTKGSLMVHSLRVLVNNDTAFFNTCKSYLNKYRFKTASSADLQAHFAQRFGSVINSFFNCYIYDKGNIDLQIESVETTGPSLKIWARVMSRYKTYLPIDLPIITVKSAFIGNSPAPVPLVFHRNSDGRYFANVADGINFSSLSTLSDNGLGMMNATTHDQKWIYGTGLQTFSNTLLSITVQNNLDSNWVAIQHHFAGPYVDPTLQPRGIRVSNERFWHVDGSWVAFKTTAFFNYDGTITSKSAGHLDNELITGSEDSLVLLYRPNPLAAFEIETDLTKQMGASKVDKTGRFWVNNLKRGDYVFGYYDFTAGIKGYLENSGSIKIFPNPTDDLVTIELPEFHSHATITIYNTNGVLIEQFQIGKTANAFKFQTANWTKGNYILVYNDQLRSINQTFIVK